MRETINMTPSETANAVDDAIPIDNLHDVAAVTLDCRPGERIMASQRRPHPLRVLLPEASAPLDVGEQEGNRARGQQ